MKFLFPCPPNLLISAMSVVSLVSLVSSGFSEARGKHFQYSKFWNANSPVTNQIKLSGRNGMLLLYTPAFFAGLSSFWLLPDQDLRFLYLKSALTFHFFKRTLEVLFIHSYSGSMILVSLIPMSFNYFASTATMIYAQHVIQGYPEPSIDLTYPGIVLFLIGIGGNFYHHYLLSKLRSKNDKEYKIPKGGLFDLVICPHYLFEILGFWGVFFISQTLYSFIYAFGTTLYLMGRSYATRRWYLSKFEDFPKHVKALFPFVY